MGGEGADLVALSSVERAKIDAEGNLGPWQPTTPMLAPRRSFAAVAAGDYLYAFGGRNSTGGGLSSVERAAIHADGSLGPWESMPAMASTRHQFAATVWDDHVYALGGESSAGARSVEAARIQPDGSLGPWEIISEMTTSRQWDPAAVALDGQLYA